MQQITFDSHGYKISGHLFTASAPQPLAFLMIQGWRGHQNLGAAQALADLGFTTLTYDMRGNGLSEGNIADFSRADFIADAVTAYDFLKQQVGPGTEIGVVGASFGSYTSILLTKERPIKCLSLRVPATYPDDGFTEPQEVQVKSPELAVWRSKPKAGDNRAFNALSIFDGKVQIIEAECDETVPHRAVQNYVDSANKANLESILMRNAPHRLENSKLREEYIDLLTTWVKRVSSRSQDGSRSTLST